MRSCSHCSWLRWRMRSWTRRRRRVRHQGHERYLLDMHAVSRLSGEKWSSVHNAPVALPILGACELLPLTKGEFVKRRPSKPLPKVKKRLRGYLSCLSSDSKLHELRYQVMRGMRLLQRSTNSPRQIVDGRESSDCGGEWRRPFLA
jgi:hypothetical protein